MFQIDLPLLTAFLGGILSFLSPCLLPVLPGYFGYMSGILLSNDGIKGKKLLAHAVAYSLGFTIILMLVGTAIGGIAKTLATHRKILEIFDGRKSKTKTIQYLNLSQPEWFSQCHGARASGRF